ncbi:hypothetical protein Acr_15g0017160 [Actinidia rufa]|uniref:Uncharacterized protein n=1 Tax=Actinidia rufa TaxID=165716 RepID=A0A7J0FYU7_9ERIC|nr:hypothetical protein Acr_15g0017160 [Actinidia rufa]
MSHTSCAIRFLQAKKRRKDGIEENRKHEDSIRSLSFLHIPFFSGSKQRITKSRTSPGLRWQDSLPDSAPQARRSMEGERRDSAPPAMTERAKPRRAKTTAPLESCPSKVNYWLYNTLFGAGRWSRIWPSPGFLLPPLSFSRVWHHFYFPDFFSKRPPNPATAGYVTDRGYPRPWSRGPPRG